MWPEDAETADNKAFLRKGDGLKVIIIPISLPVHIPATVVPLFLNRISGTAFLKAFIIGRNGSFVKNNNRLHAQMGIQNKCLLIISRQRIVEQTRIG